MDFKDSPSLDHIDPTWGEGRDYQLVCGLDCKHNWRELTVGDNSRKSNRFLPWRFCSEEIGQKPVESGDLVQFLVGFDIENDSPGEWVLMEFEGEEWYTLSKRYCAERQGGLKMGPQTGSDNVKLKRGFCKPGVQSAAGKKGGAVVAERKVGVCDPQIRKEAVEKSARLRSVPIVVTEIKTGQEKVFPSRNEASRVLGLDRKGLSKVLKGEHKQCKGYVVRYLEKP